VNRIESNAQRRTLERAIGIAQGDDKLAAFLGVTAADLQRWSAGRAPIPLDIFLALVDVVSANQLRRAPLRKQK
jgi:DNA-binding transcriptional regulator YdaS (Cro superfamily)